MKTKKQNCMNSIIGMQLCLVLAACSGQETVVGSEQSKSPADTSSVYSSAHLTFYYTGIDRDSIHAIAKYVEASHDRIVADLKPESLSTIRIYLYPTLQDVHRAIGWPDAPSWVKGSATGINEIRMISPTSTDLDASVTYDYMLSCLVHEFAHCITMHVNQTIANRPRWLWEAVAIYESGQFVDPKKLEYLRDGHPPSLGDLNNINDTRIYQVGYTIMEYVVSTWGIEAVRGLIRSNAHLVETIHMSETEFQESWYHYVTDRYLK
jgi:hypothetical protein